MDKSLFENPGEIDASLLDGLEISNDSDSVEEALRRWDWSGRPAGCLLLKLSPDNATVASGQFAVRGKLASEEISWEASKLWTTGDTGTVLSIRIPAAETFKFGGGGLASDYLSMSEIEHTIRVDGETIQASRANYANHGIGRFSMRMVCSIQKAAKSGITLKYSVMLFPASATEMMERCGLARNPGWPGLKLVEGEMGLMPKPPTPWGCPVLPLLLTGTPWDTEEVARSPAAEELRNKIAWIMATSEPPDCVKTLKVLNSKWEKLTGCPGEYCPKRSPLTWPKPQQRTTQGRKLLSIIGNINTLVVLCLYQ